MPVKKATRSTRSTRTTKTASKAPSSDVIMDQGIGASSNVSIAKAKSAQPTAAPTKVLGERDAQDIYVSSPLKDSSKSRSTEVKVASQKSTKSKKGRGVVDEDITDGSRATTPVPSSPSKKGLPEEQVQQFLQNYDLEAQARISRLRASLEMSVQSAVTRMRLAVERIPRAVRELQLSEFIDEYGADIYAFMNRAPVQHLKETQEEWDQIREERSPSKTKRSKKDEGVAGTADRKLKSARTTTSTASASRAAAGNKKAGSRSTKASLRSASAAPTSPAPSPAASSASAKPAPSLSTFQPDLPKEALQTPKPRMARPGEIIQWQSINGSPICGIIGADGMVRPVSMA